jgi:hypothetical protein
MKATRTVLLAALLLLLAAPLANAQTSCPKPANPGVNVCLPEKDTKGYSVTTTPVHVVASATGNGGIKYIQIYIRGVKYATYHTDHIDVHVDMDGGGYLVVQAKDETDQVFKVYRQMDVYGATTGCDTTAPGTVKICSPFNAQFTTVPTTFRLVAVAASSAGISYMQVYANGKKYATYYTSHVDSTITLPPSGTRLTVLAKDKAGAIFKRTIYPDINDAF